MVKEMFPEAPKTTRILSGLGVSDTREAFEELQASSEHEHQVCFQENMWQRYLKVRTPLPEDLRENQSSGTQQWGRVWGLQ